MATPTKSFDILIAEDNAGDVALVRRALKEHNVDGIIHVIQDGAQAIQWIERLDSDPTAPRLDLMLLDMHLPKGDGKDILTRLRSSRRYAQTPVVMMSSLDASALREIGGKLGARVYFRKPTKLDEFMQLGSIVRRILNGEIRDSMERSETREPSECVQGSA